MTTVGVVIRHAGFAPVEEQRAAIAQAGGADWVEELEPRTMEDWHYRYAEALDERAEGDVLAVASLSSLGVSSAEIFDTLALVTERKLQLRSAAEGIDTAAQPGFLEAAAALHGAIDAGRLITAKQILADAAQRRTVSPPKAQFVDADLWQQLDTE